ncbi:MAG: immunoglobulin domain-containing protein [Verrucomicrobiota bacterium]
MSLLWLLLLPGVKISAQSVAPQLTSVGIASSRGNGLYATTGDTITLSFTADQLLQTPEVSILSKQANVSSGSGLQWTATIPVTEEDDSGPVGFVISYSNLEGDAGSSVAATTNGSHVIIDRNFPEITSGPQDVTASAGGSFSLSIMVSSSSLFTCQWRRDQIPIPLATETTFTRTNIQTTDTGYYDVVVTNLVGEAIGGPVFVQVFGGAPAIVRQPAPRSVATGSPVSFTVQATGAHELSYQWRKAGKPILGETNPILAIASSQKADAAAYSVVVSNAFGSITSDAVALTVAAANITGLPLIDPQPPSVLVAAGHATGFYAPATGAPTLSYEWRKNGAKITGAPNSNSYGFDATLALAGTYSVLVKNSVGSVISVGARLAVVDTTASPDVVAAQGDAVTLKAVTAGTGLLYQWQKAGEEIQDATVSATRSIKGAQTATLTIKGTTIADRGSYRCVVRLGNQTLPTSAKQVRIYTAGPEILLSAGAFIREGIVGGTYTGDPIPILDGESALPTTYTATPLPPGLKMNPATGIIMGKPTKASTEGKPFEFTLKVANKLGAPTVKVKMVIKALPPLALGNFAGTVNFDAGINSDLGGKFALTTTSSGTFSGSLTLGAKPHSFSGGVLEVPMVGDPSGSIFIKSAGLTLSFTIDLTLGGAMNGTLDNDSILSPIHIEAWPNALPVATSTIAYTALIDVTPGQLNNPAGLIGYPQGYGFITLSVTKTGAATWGGRMADGTAITGGGNHGYGGRVPLHLLLYGSTGSVQGWSQIVGNNLDGYLFWSKKFQGLKSTTRSYKDGFPQHQLNVTGGVYTAPAKDHIVIGLPPACMLSFYDGYIPGFAFNQPLTLTTANKVQISSSANQVKVTSLTPANGLFGGTFGITQRDLLDSTEPFGNVTRPGTFSGVFVQRLSKGYGHFLLPERPDQAGESVTNTPIWSGMTTWEVDTN